MRTKSAFLFLFFCLRLSAQTPVPTRCAGIIAPGVLASIMIPVQILGVSIGIPTCVQFDSTAVSLDKTTTPPTLRLLSGGAAKTPIAETPAGTVNGINAVFTTSQTPAGGMPVQVYRNGVLLQACVVLPCNGDYQVAGGTITFLAASQTAAAVTTVPLSGDLLQVLYWH